MSALDQFRPIGELMESEDAVVIDRRAEHWHHALAEAVDRVVDDGETVYLVEDGKRVAVVKPLGGE